MQLASERGGERHLDNSVNEALNVLYQRRITSREQLLTEALRVHITASVAESESNTDVLFSLMKQHTEDVLGFFPADRDDFTAIYQALKKVDLYEFVLGIYQDDRSGTVITPLPLLRYINERVLALTPQSILIPEAERHLAGLPWLISQWTGEITLTTQYKPFYELFKLLFARYRNVTIRFISIYSAMPDSRLYDYIFCLPAFGGKSMMDETAFLTRDLDGVALENMLHCLHKHGTMDYIAPAKITFTSTDGYKQLRSLITSQYGIESISILPEGTFRPWTSIKTYLLSIKGSSVNDITLGELHLKGDTLSHSALRLISLSDFQKQSDWRIEMLLSSEDEKLKRYQHSSTRKVKLKDVAEVFRGKSILKKDAVIGDIAVLNISNIDQGDIRYEDMDTIQDDPRKVKRYELLTGDVVLACRGTAIKSAVFAQRKGMTIASANIIVIRPTRELLPGYIHLFLESPVGQVLIQSIQRGMTVMNLNYTDIMEMEIPLLPMEKQALLTQTYESEKAKYKETLRKAEERYTGIQAQIYDEII